MVIPEKEKEGQISGEILRVNTSTGKVSEVCSPSVDGYGGMPAGCQFDKENNLWVADLRLGILKVNVKDNTFKQMFKVDSSGRTLQGCNDCSLDYDGTLWVTASAGDIAPADYRWSTEESLGSVYSMTADGKCNRIDTGCVFPNGVAVQHDSEGNPKLLIVAETYTKLLWCYDITGPGEVKQKRIWAKMPGDHEGGADGMDFDEKGRLLVANWGSGYIEVFGPEGGNPEFRIQCPFQHPSNLHFQPGTSEVFLTEHENHALWKFKWINKGRKEAIDLP